MEKTKDLLFKLIRASLWEEKFNDRISKDIFDGMKTHAIYALPAQVLSTLNMDDTLKKEWTTTIIRQVSHYTQYSYIQSHLPIHVPYVILKGTTAAQYYPHPQYRVLGDIDIITRREDYSLACDILINNGYKEITTQNEFDQGRHRSFIINGLVVEIHSYFAMFSDPIKAEYLDNLIIENINDTHVLPDLVNGLVLLEHINQHLEEGIGLRQIVDWMMFSYKVLTDEKWVEFKKQAEFLKLEYLAIVITKMCEIYLGLPKKNWSNEVSEDICEQLMDYIMSCGNFGTIRSRNISIGENVFYAMKTPKSFWELLQERGVINWKAAQKYHFLKPLAFVYQATRYIFMGFKREKALLQIKNEYELAKQRRHLFESLGVKQKGKGLAVYIDGHYIKRP